MPYISLVASRSFRGMEVAGGDRDRDVLRTGKPGWSRHKICGCRLGRERAENVRLKGGGVGVDKRAEKREKRRLHLPLSYPPLNPPDRLKSYRTNPCNALPPTQHPTHLLHLLEVPHLRPRPR
jgi:hypothetical protein